MAIFNITQTTRHSNTKSHNRRTQLQNLDSKENIILTSTPDIYLCWIQLQKVLILVKGVELYFYANENLLLNFNILRTCFKRKKNTFQRNLKQTNIKTKEETIAFLVGIFHFINKEHHS